MDASMETLTAIKTPRTDRPIALTYDFVQDHIFWTDFSENVVKRSFLNGSDTVIIKFKENGKWCFSVQCNIFLSCSFPWEMSILTEAIITLHTLLSMFRTSPGSSLWCCVFLFLGSRIDGLAFEPFSRLLYYTDTGRHEIGIMNPSGIFRKVLVRGEDVIHNPRAIALDSEGGWDSFQTRYLINRVSSQITKCLFISLFSVVCTILSEKLTMER